MNFKILRKLSGLVFSVFQVMGIILLYFFSGFKSKKKNLWGFGSLDGKEFRGNYKSMLPKSRKSKNGHLFR